MIRSRAGQAEGHRAQRAPWSRSDCARVVSPAGAAALAVGALFLAGLGIANLYPLSLALTLGLLGALADRRGLATGFALEPVLIGGGAVLLWAGLRTVRSAVRPRATGPSGGSGESGG
ncbi:hypothetical protein [Micromonospora sp. NPDC050495]|uniref:hypothetical protein n=1 Tax=Micromonospora sp. NPDC050495 TaxID=3154936 RepID=UPI0033CFC80B